MTDWINIEKEIPDGLQFVLVYCPEDKGLKIRIAAFGSYINAEHNFGITHWMPLPAPPTEDTKFKAVVEKSIEKYKDALKNLADR